MLERVSTGMDGLDKLLGGGFGKGFLIDVAGGAGTYKSTFAMQFAVEGIRRKEKVTYISLAEPQESYGLLAEDLGMAKEFAKVDFQIIEIDELMGIWYSAGASSGSEEFAKMILKMVGDPDRLVLDTVTTIALYSSKTEVKTKRDGGSEFVVPSQGDMCVMLIFLASALRKKGCTTLLLAESGEGDLYLPEKMLGYICDGKIELRKSSQRTASPRTLAIDKMRHIEHPLNEQPIALTKDGLSMEQS